MTFQKKKKDHELLGLYGLSFLGLGVLASVNIWYSDWGGMFETWAHWGAIIGIIGIALVIIFAIVMLVQWEDPNYDKYRHLFWVGCLLAIIYICSFKVAKLDRIESPIKQEQVQ